MPRVQHLLDVLHDREIVAGVGPEGHVGAAGRAGFDDDVRAGGLEEFRVLMREMVAAAVSRGKVEIRLGYGRESARAARPLARHVLTERGQSLPPRICERLRTEVLGEAEAAR